MPDLGVHKQIKVMASPLACIAELRWAKNVTNPSRGSSGVWPFEEKFVSV